MLENARKHVLSLKNKDNYNPFKSLRSARIIKLTKKKYFYNKSKDILFVQNISISNQKELYILKSLIY